ncbi:hypothetical protein EUX98_g8670 [Antrodiella citrinella]|uniref:Uncharacterized protein n=1 Tax=Antrodiella citrinella TaxID=2447956 RepID=A0A4S4M6L0_9APHY|nr:hypothetical protein EUX98_g8670 [Antrodiella citrinella]
MLDHDFEPSQVLEDVSARPIAQRRGKRNVRKSEITTSQLYAPGDALDSQTTDSQYVDNLIRAPPRQLGYIDQGVQTEALACTVPAMKPDESDAGLALKKMQQDLERATATATTLRMSLVELRAEMSVLQVRSLFKDDKIEMQAIALQELQDQLARSPSPTAEDDLESMIAFPYADGYVAYLEGSSECQSQKEIEPAEVRRRLERKRKRKACEGEASVDQAVVRGVKEEEDRKDSIPIDRVYKKTKSM